VVWRGEHKPRISPNPNYRPNVGWVPLGYNEPYDPPFHASPAYVRASNLSNTRLGRGELDRFIEVRQHGGATLRYANDSVAGAYSAAPAEAFSAANAFGPPRTVIAQQTALPPDRHVPHAPAHTPPGDRPVARPAYVATTVRIDRPAAQPRASGRSEPRQLPDRPPRQMQSLVARVQPVPRSIPSVREVQPTSGASEPRRAFYAPAPAPTAGAVSVGGAREAHRSAVHVEHRP
jgi:hypothetical protein